MTPIVSSTGVSAKISNSPIHSFAIKLFNNLIINIYKDDRSSDILLQIRCVGDYCRLIILIIKQSRFDQKCNSFEPDLIILLWHVHAKRVS